MRLRFGTENKMYIRVHYIEICVSNFRQSVELPAALRAEGWLRGHFNPQWRQSRARAHCGGGGRAAVWSVLGRGEARDPARRVVA